MPGAVVGSTTAAVFEAYVEKVLAPSLRDGRVVVMDDLSAHEGERVRGLIEGRGCELLFLPPRPPDFNPIEEAFAKIEGILRERGRSSNPGGPGGSDGPGDPGGHRSRRSKLLRSLLRVRRAGSIVMTHAVGVGAHPSA